MERVQLEDLRLHLVEDIGRENVSDHDRELGT